MELAAFDLRARRRRLAHYGIEHHSPGHPDAVVLDIMLPDGNGLDLLEVLIEPL